MTVSKRKTLLFSGTLIVLGLAVTGAFYTLSPADAADPAASAQQAPQAMPVKITIVEQKPLRLWSEYSGRLEAIDYVQLRPQVSGQINDIKFVDGQIVKEGDILFVIDPSPYQARVAQAEAELQAAKNAHELAQKNSKRAEGLVKSAAISERTYDERKNEASVTRSAVDSAQARLRQAQIDLDYAYVKAPISGRVSRAEITKGNIVQAGPNAPVLTTIVSTDGIYADFEVDEKTYLNTIHNVAQTTAAENAIPVELVLKNDGTAPYQGSIKSFDNRIDTTSGTIRARALFENPGSVLLPGMFVTVRLGSPTEAQAILLDERAVGTDQDRKFVFVVGDDNKVVYREVKMGASTGGQRVIVSGLEPGEKVIVEGVMKIRPDMLVDPQPAGEEAAPLPVDAAPSETQE